MKLVADAKDWWKWHSTYVFALIGIFPIVWLNSPDLQAQLPAGAVSLIAPFMAALGFFLRIREQVKAIPKPDSTDQEGA